MGGVLITGGSPSRSVGVKVEVFNLHSKRSCQLLDLPGGVRASRHSLCDRMLCGGRYSTRSCRMLNPLTGDFTTTSVTLVENRRNHLCWNGDGENGPTLLIGGSYSSRSTELVRSDGLTSSASFNLTYGTE